MILVSTRTFTPIGLTDLTLFQLSYFFLCVNLLVVEFLQKTFYLCMSFSTRYFIHFRTVPLLILVTTTVGGVDKVISKKESIY